jgi:hypothetical protein
MARCIYGDLFGKQSLTKPQPLERERESGEEGKKCHFISERNWENKIY